MSEKEEKFQVICNNCSIKVGNSGFSTFIPYNPDFGNIANIRVLLKGQCGQGRQIQLASFFVGKGNLVYVYSSDTSEDEDIQSVYKLQSGYCVFMLDEDTGEITIEY